MPTPCSVFQDLDKFMDKTDKQATHNYHHEVKVKEVEDSFREAVKVDGMDSAIYWLTKTDLATLDESMDMAANRLICSGESNKHFEGLISRKADYLMENDDE